MRFGKIVETMLSAAALVAVVGALSLPIPRIDPDKGGHDALHSAGDGFGYETKQGLCEDANTATGQVTESECFADPNAVGKSCLRCDTDSYTLIDLDTPGSHFGVGPQNYLACNGFKLLGDCLLIGNPPSARACVNIVVQVDEFGQILRCSGQHKPTIVEQVGGPGGVE